LKRRIILNERLEHAPRKNINEEITLEMKFQEPCQRNKYAVLFGATPYDDLQPGWNCAPGLVHKSNFLSRPSSRAASAWSRS
jgi:hypothetical protein